MSITPAFYPNKPYSQIYSLTDPRFYFPSSNSGSILYYSSVYQRWTGSDIAFFHWDDVTNTLSTANHNTDTIVFNDYAPFPVQMKLECINGNLFFTPIPSISPYASGTVSIGGTGTVSIGGSTNFLGLADRSTGDIFQVFTSGGVYTLKSNFSQNVFEISTAGSAKLQGTSAGLRFYERIATPINYYEFFTSTSGSVFNLTFNGTSIGTVTSVGVTTLIPTKIQNTLQTTGTQFLTMLPLSATTSAGQVVGTHASLNYVVSSSTLSSTNFTGALSGSASRVGNTLQTTGTQFLTMLPLSASTASQVVGTHASLTYNAATGTLSATNASIGTTFTIGGTNTITYNSLNTRTTFSGGSGILVGGGISLGTSYSGSGVVGLSMVCNAGVTDVIVVFDSTTTTQLFNLNGVRITTTLPITAPSFIGALTGSASRVGNTLQTTGTQFITFLPLSASTASQVVGTHASLTYNVATSTLSATTFSGGLTGAATQVFTVAVGSSVNFFIPFVASSSTSNQTLGVDSGIFYNPSTNALTASLFFGASSLVITTAATNNIFYFPFFGEFSSSQPAGQAVLNDSNLRYNPSQNLLEIVSGTMTSLYYNSTYIYNNSRTSGSADYYVQYTDGANGTANFKMDYFNGSTSSSITPFEITPNGSCLLGTSAGTGTDLIFYGVGTNTIDTIDGAKGKIEFLMSNTIRFTAGGASPGTATLNNSGAFTVSELLTSSLRMNGAINTQGFGYSPTRLVAQNVASSGSFGSGLYAYLLLNGTTWISSSDRRLKYDIKPFEPCLDKILALNPVSYKWIETQTPALGFIAQEVLEIIPELVNVPEDPDIMMGIDLTNMTAFLVKAMQEQQVMIKKLEERINILESLNGSTNTV